MTRGASASESYLLWPAAEVFEILLMSALCSASASASSPVAGLLSFFLPPADCEHAS